MLRGFWVTAVSIAAVLLVGLPASAMTVGPGNTVWNANTSLSCSGPNAATNSSCIGHERVSRSFEVTEALALRTTDLRVENMVDFNLRLFEVATDTTLASLTVNAAGTTVSDQLLSFSVLQPGVLYALAAAGDVFFPVGETAGSGRYGFQAIVVPVAQTPLPGAIWLMLSGLTALLLGASRRKAS